MRVKKCYTECTFIHHTAMHPDSFETFGDSDLNPPGNNEAWEHFLDVDAFAQPRAKARPNKFLAIGLHFFSSIQASRK